MQPGPGQEVGCLLEMVKSHYHKAGPRMTESQRTEQTKRLLASLPEGTSLSEQMLRMATELQLVETIPVSPMGPATDFVGVNMYVDDQAQAKGLPLNPRASSILATCRCPHQVFGDAFIARLQDNEAADVFKRMDFRLSELNSSSEWIRQAQQLNDPQGLRAQAGGRGSSAPAGAGGAGAGGGGQKKAAPPAAKGGGGGPAAEPAERDPAARAELEKLVGNRLFKQGRYEKAVEHYSRAVEGGEGAVVRVYLNNRAAALLQLGKGAEAEADCDRILAEEPGNVKALFRRGTARRSQGRVQDALVDFEHCLKVDPKSAEAKSNIEELRAALSGQGGGAGGGGAGGGRALAEASRRGQRVASIIISCHQSTKNSPARQPQTSPEPRWPVPSPPPPRLCGPTAPRCSPSLGRHAPRQVVRTAAVGVAEDAVGLDHASHLVFCGGPRRRGGLLGAPPPGAGAGTVGVLGLGRGPERPLELARGGVGAGFQAQGAVQPRRVLRRPAGEVWEPHPVPARPLPGRP